MDNLIKAMVLNNEASVVVCKTSDIVNQAIKNHDMSPTSAAALGRLLTAGVMMTTELKNQDDSLTLTLKGDGEIGSIVVSGDYFQTVRGYADNPKAEAPIKPSGKLNVCGVVGTSGRLTVIKSNGKNSPYVGVSEIVSGEIAEDLTYYYATSEQKQTAISLGVLVDGSGRCISSGGVSIHVLPFASEQTIQKLERIVQKVSGISNILQNKTPKQLIEELFLDDFQINLDVCPKYECKCSRESIEKVVVTLPKDEIESIKRENGKLEVICHFCGKKYEF